MTDMINSKKPSGIHAWPWLLNKGVPTMTTLPTLPTTTPAHSIPGPSATAVAPSPENRTGQSRRWFLAAAASIPAAPAIALPAMDDPIIAAIEQHKVAWLRTARAIVREDAIPAYDAKAVEEAQIDEAYAHELEWPAAFALFQVQPTSIGGVLALISYVEQFNSGGFAIPEDPDYTSSYLLWPLLPRDEHGEQKEIAWPLLSNIGRALAAIGGHTS